MLPTILRTLGDSVAQESAEVALRGWGIPLGDGPGGLG